MTIVTLSRDANPIPGHSEVTCGARIGARESGRSTVELARDLLWTPPRLWTQTAETWTAVMSTYIPAPAMKATAPAHGAELARVVPFDPELTTAVFGAFADELARWQGERSNELGVANPQTAVFWRYGASRTARGPQLGSGKAPVHAFVPDGVFVVSADGQSARCIWQDPPSGEDVACVMSRVEQRLTRVFPEDHPSACLRPAMTAGTAPRLHPARSSTLVLDHPTQFAFSTYSHIL